MSAFPTGVAVVTTLDADGEPRGLTTNALCSVSAEPPLLLVCVDKESRTLPALLHSRRFVVNFLAERRDELARLFASKTDDKFGGVAWEPGLGGMPCLREDSLAYAECETEQSSRPATTWSSPVSSSAGWRRIPRACRSCTSAVSIRARSCVPGRVAGKERRGAAAKSVSPWGPDGQRTVRAWSWHFQRVRDARAA